MSIFLIEYRALKTKVWRLDHYRAVTELPSTELVSTTRCMAGSETHAEVDPSENADQDANVKSADDATPQLLLRAWITTYETHTYSARNHELNLPFPEIQHLIITRTSEDYKLAEALEELNVSQRGYIFNHTSFLGATLVFADIWKKERVMTVFGMVELAFLVWVTSGSGPGTVSMMPPPPPPRFPPPPPTVYSNVEGAPPPGEETLNRPIDDLKRRQCI
jgi:hypothetical protein